MEQLNILEKEKKSLKKDFDKVSPILIELMTISPKKETSNGRNQNFVLKDFEQFLMKLITHDILPTREDRFAVINFLYKIQARREAIAFMTGELDMEEIEKASESLGKKMAVPKTEPFGVSISQR